MINTFEHEIEGAHTYAARLLKFYFIFLYFSQKGLIVSSVNFYTLMYNFVLRAEKVLT